MDNKKVVPLLKACSGCGETKDVELFGIDNARKDGRNPYCKECKKKQYKTFMEKEGKKDNKRASNKKWTNANRDRVNSRRRATRDPLRAWADKLRLFYNITPEIYDAMLLSQDGTCAIPSCERSPKDQRGQRLAVDHDHSCCPGKKSCGKCIRGLLCSICNRRLGHLENQRWLAEAFHYLERN